MPSVNALPVEVPFPRHEPSALFAELPSQHCITEIRKYLVGIFQTDGLQRRRTFKDPHILFDMPGSLYHRSKLPVYFRSCDICRSETDDAVSVNRAERLLIPSDVDQTVFQQLCVQFPAQELSVLPLAEIFPSAVRFLRSFLTSNLGALFDFWANEKGTGLGS